MNLIFSMLLSSNSLLLLFIVIEHFMGDAFSQKNKYLILKFALFFSILIGFCKNINFYGDKLLFPNRKYDGFIDKWKDTNLCRYTRRIFYKYNL